jgi:hypothetical protein
MEILPLGHCACFRFVRTFHLAPPSGRVALGGTIPRVETLG